MINIKDIFVGETVRVKNDEYEYYVKVHLIDEDSGRAYCSDEVLGISMWHDIENLEKLPDDEYEPEQQVQDDEFLAFVQALKAVAEFNGIDVPQVEIEEEPNVVDDDYDDFDLDFDDDYEDDILDERYDGNRFPWYKFDFYQALEELKFQHENEDKNAIWYMTNGERALTFKDERLVDVRLADHVENLVYFAAPIQLKDLNDEWEVNKIVDEEAKKINEIVLKIQELKDNELVHDLLYIIEKYTE
jgi:hypothetical protein